MEEGENEHGVKWTHPTIVPHRVTPPDVARTFGELWKENKSNMDVRLDKLLCASADKLEMIGRAARRSDHVEHWMKTLSWIDGIRVHAKGKTFNTMTFDEKMYLRVVALATGSSSGGVHFDFQKAANVVDFLTMFSEDAILATMNGRRDERNYMVPQVARAMESHNVTDPRTISLWWDGKYQHDLDIHVVTPQGQHVYYHSKEPPGSFCKLNFDANASVPTDNPVENVSVLQVQPGPYKVYVNNYRTRGKKCDVPFQVVIKELGRDPLTIDGVWHAHKLDNQVNTFSYMVLVATHVFDDMPLEEVVMSEKQASRATANESAWITHIGDPQSCVASTEDAIASGRRIVYAAMSPTTGPNSNVSEFFMNLAVSGAKPRGDTGFMPKMRYITDLLTHMQKSPTKVYVRAYDVSPGYFVRFFNTPSKVTYDDLSGCHYRDQGHLPTVPSARGNARCDAEWFDPRDGRTETSLIPVHSFVVKDGEPLFMVLEGAKLPERGSTKFPLGGGFHTTLLKPEFHVHRAKWHMHHSMTTPEMCRSRGKPLIGGFLTANDVDVPFYVGEAKRYVLLRA